jgi:hypothetical protein
MKLVTHTPFPTHPHLTRETLVWSRSERDALNRASAIVTAARDAIGPESDQGMDLGKVVAILSDYIDGVEVTP